MYRKVDEERIMWLCFLAMAAIIGWSAGRLVP